MFEAMVEPVWSVDAWRAQARLALAADLPPDQLQWLAGAQGGLPLGEPLSEAAPVRAVPTVPAALMELAGSVACHRDPRRFGLLYRIAWRVTHGERALLERATDADIVAANALAQAVRRDTHKMKAFVRFRRLPVGDEAYMAWFEPDHWIVDRVAPFFAKRFAGMRWAILTPYRSVRWTGEALEFGPGGVRDDAPRDDAHEDLWRTYYANIFNPARINPTMMRQEMPQKYWKGLPEATLLPGLLRDAGARTQAMVERAPQPVRRRIPSAPAAPVVRASPEADADGSPSTETPQAILAAGRVAIAACRRCDLWAPATRAVFGEGPADAAVMIVGEQPGDEEDLTGRPFVGPAGKLLDRALAELGIARERLYVTNAVKHFRFEQRGRARIHKNPAVAHVRACRAWLDQELDAVRPGRIVCLGATAARAVIGPGFELMRERGTWRTLGDGDGVEAMATVHPAWVLRQPAGDARDVAYRGFVDDLRTLEPVARGP